MPDRGLLPAACVYLSKLYQTKDDKWYVISWDSSHRDQGVCVPLGRGHDKGLHQDGTENVHQGGTRLIGELFELAGGTVIGKDHIFSRKPNQDAHHFVSGQELIVGIVCDGCGDPTSPHSEVGARIASTLLTNTLVACPEINPTWMDIVRNQALTSIDSLSTIMASSTFGKGTTVKSYQMVRDHFLFTVMGFAITPEESYFFSIGDGTMFVNGEQIEVGPFPNNEPPYMCYALMDSSLLKSDPGCLKFQIRRIVPTESLESFLIGSDGVQHFMKAGTLMHPNGKQYVGSVDQFWTNDIYFGNPEQINRKLYLVNKDHTSLADGQVKHGHLPDDTTLIVGRRKYPGTASVLPE